MVPLHVIIRLVSRVLVHGLLECILSNRLLWVLSHWRLWVLVEGLLVVLPWELLLGILTRGLLVVLIILFISLNALIWLVSGIFTLVFLIGFPLFSVPVWCIWFPDLPIEEFLGFRYFP